MSGAMTEPTTQHARKRYPCEWCGESINIGDEYTRYRWFSYGDAGTCKMHPECYEAMQAEAEQEGGWIEWCPGDQERPKVAS